MLLVSRGTSLVGLRSVRDVQFVLQLERCRVIRASIVRSVFTVLLSSFYPTGGILPARTNKFFHSRDKKYWMDCLFGIRRRKLNQILIKRRNLFPKKQIYYCLCNLSEITCKNSPNVWTTKREEKRIEIPYHNSNMMFGMQA